MTTVTTQPLPSCVDCGRPMRGTHTLLADWPAKPSDWMAQALCAQIDPDLWYPDPGDAHAAQTAAAVCRTCPVRADCLDYAMATEAQGGRHGVWGGLTPTARDRLHHRRKDAA